MATEDVTSERDLANVSPARPSASGTSPPLGSVPSPADSSPRDAETPPPDAVPSSSASMGHDRTVAPDRERSTSGEFRSSRADAVDDPLVGSVIADRYRLIERVGEGGMGAVYRGEHVALRKRVAVKFLHAEMSRIPDVVARFEREAVAAANLEHPNVVAAHDFGKTSDGVFFLVMEFVDGGSLRDLLQKEGRLQPTRALHIARHIASALQRAHALGIVHRDLKPENVVLVEREGDRDFAKVIDFGIAKVAAGRLAEAGQALTQAGMVFGTPDYMAPEQALGGKVDHRADLYAFGVMVFEMLVGQRPFEADDVMALLGKHMTQPPPSASSMAPPGMLTIAVDQVLAKALAKSPSERFNAAIDIVHALEAALGMPTMATGGTYPPGMLMPVPASIGTPPHGLQAPPPSSITASGPALNVTSPPVIKTGSPASAVARETLNTLISGYSDLRSNPVRHKRVIIGAAVVAVVVLGFALATRPKSATPPSGIAATPTPVVPRSIANRAAATPPTTTITPPLPSTVTPPPVAPNNAQPAPAADETAGPGLPAELATQLAEYEARPNVRVLLDAARGRQLRAVITAFEQTRAQAPDDAIVNYLLGTLYAHDRGHAGLAVERYSDAARLSPGFTRDPTLLRDVVSAYANQRRAVPQAAALLTGALSPNAGPYLIEAFMTTHNASVRSRLLTVLAAAPYNAYADPTVRGLIELSTAYSCQQKLPVVQQLGREGDARAIPYLRRIQVSPNGCGMFGLGACNPCLEEALPQAVYAIQQRHH